MSRRGPKSLSKKGFAVAEVSRLLEPPCDAPRIARHEVTKLANNYLSSYAIGKPATVREDRKRFGGDRA